MTSRVCAPSMQCAARSRPRTHRVLRRGRTCARDARETAAQSGPVVRFALLATSTVDMARETRSNQRVDAAGGASHRASVIALQWRVFLAPVPVLGDGVGAPRRLRGGGAKHGRRFTGPRGCHIIVLVVPGKGGRARRHARGARLWLWRVPDLRPCREVLRESRRRGALVGRKRA